jgi:arylsulfatase A-like enzyme
MTLAVLLACWLALVPRENTRASAQTSQKPNIVFVLTDDNDTQTYENFMPRTKQLIGDAGVTFENATYGHSLCCPSRASIQRGQYPHNTQVYKNSPPNGGFQTFKARGRAQDTYATDLREAGYRTGYFGKYMNGYEGFLSFKPPGWDYWFAGSPMGKEYSLNGRVRTTVGNTTYQEARFDKLVADKGIGWIDNASEGTKPFMAALNFFAPHTPAEHPPSFDKMYRDVPLHKPPSYNEENRSDKPQWLQNAPSISSKNEQSMTKYYRNRLRSVEYVDRQVERLVNTLEKDGELHNTYIVFYSDNGYHLGEHRLPGYVDGGKTTPYIEDIRFPIVLRGPGIDGGQTSEAMVQNIDLRSTFDEMGGTQAPDYVDGTSFLAAAQGTGTFPRQYAYAERLESDSGGSNGGKNADWKAVYTPDMAYHYWFRSGEEELYNLGLDPYQLDNMLKDGGSEAEAIPFREVMQQMESCRGAGCSWQGSR